MLANVSFVNANLQRLLMTNLINQTLQQIQADLVPTTVFRRHMPDMQYSSFMLGTYSIIRWTPTYYSGQFEVYHASWDDPFWAPTLLEIFQHIASLDPSVFYSPSTHPELFI